MCHSSVPLTSIAREQRERNVLRAQLVEFSNLEAQRKIRRVRPLAAARELNVLLGTQVQKGGTVELDTRSGILAMEYPASGEGHKISKTSENPTIISGTQGGSGKKKNCRQDARCQSVAVAAP